MKGSISIRTMISIAMVLITGIFIIIGVAAFNYFHTGSIHINTERYLQEIITQINNNVDSYISDIVDVAEYARHLARTDTAKDLQEIKTRFNTLVSSRDDIVRIAIYDLTGRVIASSDWNEDDDPGKTRSLLWFKRAYLGEGDFFFTGPHTRKNGQQADLVITYSQLISFGPINTPAIPVVLLIDLNFNTIAEISRSANLYQSGYTYLISNDGTIVYHPRQEEIDDGSFVEDIESVEEHVYGMYGNHFQGKERLINIQTVNQTRWRIVGVIFMDEVMAPLYAFRRYLAAISLLMLILTVIIITIISNRISKPLRELEGAMSAVQRGNFSPTIPDVGYSEIRSLSRSFSMMVSKIDDLMRQVRITEKIKRQRELDALQAKIHPHFLYNTLDSVIWLAESGDSKGVVKLVSALASLFRISIAKGHDTITLREEFMHVESYLQIQSIRYKDKFTYSMELPEELENSPTIKLIIQPIVENSIYHGIKYLQECGLITIKAEGSEGKIKITVSDNGVGMDEKTLSSLLSSTAVHSSSGNGIGLANIDERIRLSYGEEYGLSIVSELDIGTTVTITIPQLSPIDSILIRKR